MTLRIAVGGFMHESHSFAPRPTRYADFLAPGGFPPLVRGAPLFAAVKGTSVPIAGAIAAGAEAGVDMVPLACDYRLIADNVLDATHLTYVHASSIGGGGLAETTPSVEHDENKVRVSRWVLDRPPPPMYKKAGDFDGNADRWAFVEFRPPICSINFAGCVDVGRGGPSGDIGASKRRVELVAISVPTPATENSCHYFFGFSRAFAHDDPDVERMFGETMVDVFREDFVILEAQQRMMEKYPNAPQVSTVNDRAAFFARRMLERMIEAEQGASAIRPNGPN